MGALTTAYVLVAPDMRSFGKELKVGLRRIDVTSSGRDAGSRFSSGFGDKSGKALKRGLVGAGIAAGGAFAGALTKGFGRLSAIENAEAKLTGLGHSAKTVDKIMVNALASVKGTAFGLDEASTLAATAVASGIKPGRELERTLKLVADAATIGGTSLGDMGAIFSQVAASNKVQGDTINQLNERGIPILKLLADVTGKSQGEVSALASKGKIDFATFQKAMEKGLGGAALKSGNTATGAFKNMGAAFSRVGAALLKGVFPQIGSGFGLITKGLDAVTPAAGRFGEALGGALAQVSGFVRERLLPAFAGIKARVLPDLQALSGFVTTTLVPAWAGWYGFLIRQMLPTLKQVGGFVVTSIVPAFRVVARFIAAEVVPGFLSIVETVKGLIRVVAPIIGEIVGVIISQFTKMRPQIESIWGSVKEIITGVMFIVKEVVQAVTTIIRLIWDRHGEQIKKIVGGAFGAIFKIVAGVMKAIAGVIKLVVALIKGDWKGAWNAIKQIFSGVWQAIRTILVGALRILNANMGGFITTVTGRWSAFWTRIRTSTSTALTAVRNTINTVLGQIRTGFSRGVDAIGTAWNRIRDVARNPVRFVVNTVLDDGLLAAFRSISNLVGFNAGKNFHVSLPGGFAGGGVLPGYTPGRDVHRFVSASGGVLDLSGGEGIARPEIVRAVGTKRWNAANAAARGGRVGDSLRYLGGFASGGVAAATQLGRSMGIGTISTYPGHHPTMALARDFMTSNASLHERLSSALWANRQALNLWYIISRRRIISMTRPGAGWQPYNRSNPHTDHVHASFYPAALRGVVGALTKAGSIAGAAFAPAVDLGKYMSQIGGAMGRLKEIGGTPFGQMVAGIPKKIVGAVRNKISSLAASFMPSLPGTPGIGDAGNLTGSNRQIGRQMMLAAGFGAQHWPALERLWTGESNWNHRARNASSGAYGIPQSLPASKMRSAGADYLTNPRTQIAWGLGYIRDRYGTPTGALNFWNSKSPHWYDDGGWLPPGLSLAMNGTGRSERVVPPGGGSRPVNIYVDLGDGVTQRVQGVLDEHDEFRASVGRMR